MSKYIILYNSIDRRYKLVDNSPNAKATDMCICDGKTVKDVLHKACMWFDISPKEVEL